MSKLADPIHILIADDEALARQRIQTLVLQSEHHCILSEASNGKEAIDLISKEKIDLVFLDIKMTDMTGFQVLQELAPEAIPIIIFVTAFDAFAIKAFEVQAIDFLLKPYKNERFFEAFDRAVNQHNLEQLDQFQHKMRHLIASVNNVDPEQSKPFNTYLNSLVLKVKKKYIFLNVSDIKYILSSGYYAEIYTHDQKRHVHRISMTRLSEQLDPAYFVRINRSVIVHRPRILEVISEGSGDYSVKMDDQNSFSLSKGYKASFLKKMGIK